MQCAPHLVTHCHIKRIAAAAVAHRYVVFIAFNINHSSILPLMALNSLYCADVPLSNYSLTHCTQIDVTSSTFVLVLVSSCLCIMVTDDNVIDDIF